MTFLADQRVLERTFQRGILAEAPDQANDSGGFLSLRDSTGNHGPLVRIDHYGDHATDESYGINLINRPGASRAICIHQYSSLTPAVQIDNTDGQPAIRLVNTENSSLNPGQFGDGDYLALWGYKAATTVADGAITSGQAILTSALGAFVSADVGKAITVAGAGPASATLSTTILSVQSATQVTLAANASTTVTGANYSYRRASNVALMGALTKDLTWGSYGANPWIFTSTTAEAIALRVVQPTGGSASAYALDVVQSSNATGLNVTNGGTGRALEVTQNGANRGVNIAQNGASLGLNVSMASGAAGNYAIQGTGYDYAGNFTTSQDGGQTLVIQKNGTGSGQALKVINKGTGDSLLLQVGSGPTTALRVNKDGYLMIATVAAPADGDLTASQVALWFDATNGAGKLKIKGKTANGTVVAGEVALA